MGARSISQRLLEGLDRLGNIGAWDADEVARARILVGSCVVVGGVMPLLLITGYLLGVTSPGRQIAVAMLLVDLVGILLVRRGHVQWVAILQCFAVGAALVFLGLHQDGLSLLQNPVVLVLPCLAFLLLGPRAGVALTGWTIVTEVGAFFLHQQGWVIPRDAIPNHRLAIVTQITIDAAIIIGGLSWLQTAAYRRAHATMEGALVASLENEARLVSIIDNTPDIVFLLDLECRMVRWNSASHAFAKKYLGYSIEYGMPFLKHTRPERVDPWMARIPRVLKGETLQYEESFGLPGAQRHLEVSVTRVPGPDGKAIGITVFARDVTARRVAEANLEEANAELRHVQKLQAIGTLSDGIAHEINNPLSSVISNLTLLRDELTQLGLPEAKLLDLLELGVDATTGAERIKRIVTDITAFSRTGEESLASVDLVQLIAQAMDLAVKEVPSRGEMVVRLEALPKVIANEMSLKKSLVNLLVNATEALAIGAVNNRVVLHAWVTEDKQVAIEVTDNGVGMSPSLLERVYEPFFTTKSVGKGTGLGLSICHGTVTRLGGQISIQSVMGMGTTVRVVLPTA